MFWTAFTGSWPTQRGTPLFCSPLLYFSPFLLSCAPSIPFRPMLLRREGFWNCKPAFEMENKFKKTSMDGFPHCFSHLHLLASFICAGWKGKCWEVWSLSSCLSKSVSAKHKWGFFEECWDPKLHWTLLTFIVWGEKNWNVIFTFIGVQVPLGSIVKTGLFKLFLSTTSPPPS